MGRNNSIAARFCSTLTILCFWLIAFHASKLPAQLTIPPMDETEAEVLPDQAATRLQDPGSGYWVVSTWSSPQSFKDSQLKFCDEVTRYDECVGVRRSSLCELSQSLIPGIPVCIAVHGSFMDSPSVVPEAELTWRWLKAGSCGHPFQMIYFSWPSDRAITLASIDITILGRRAGRNGFYLASLIQHIPPECPISLIGHSHGTRVISSSLHLMAGGEVEGRQHPFARATGRRIRAVFAASAIDHNWLNPGQRYDRALCSTECLLNLRNKFDPALMIYPLRCIGTSRALGSAGFTSKDQQRLGAWNCKVRELDVSSEIGGRHLWPYYAGNVWLARSIGHYLYFTDLSSFPGQDAAASETQ